MNNKVSDLRFYIRSKLGVNSFFIQVLGVLRGFRSEICSKDTDLVIEAYPRSANTFLVALFKYYCGEDISLARHRHAIAQFDLARRYDKPSVCVLRKPLDSIVSLAIRRDDVSVKLLINEYIDFHRGVLRHSGRDGFLLFRFEDVVKNPNKVFVSASKKLGITPKRAVTEEGDVLQQQLFTIVDEMERKDSGGVIRESHVARPSSDRKDSSVKHRKEMLIRNCVEELKNAEELYGRLLEFCE